MSVYMMQPQHYSDEGSIELRGAVQKNSFRFDEKCATILMATLGSNDEGFQSRLPLDVVVVLDKSSSMKRKDKFRLCKETCLFLAKELGEQDRFGLVVFDKLAQVVCPMAFMTQENVMFVKGTINGLSCGHGTNLWNGIEQGFKMTEPFQDEDRLKTILLLTDGYPTCGITDAVELLKNFNQLLSSRKWYTFGYGTTHDSELLTQMAKVGHGSYYFVEKANDVRTAFSDCLGGLLSIVGHQLELSLVPENGTVFVENDGQPHEYQISTVNGTEVKVEIPDLFAGEKKHILFKVELPKLPKPLDSAVIAKLILSYFDTSKKSHLKSEVTISVFRGENSQLDQQENESVSKQILRVSGVEALKHAKSKADQGNFDEAQDIVQQMAKKLHIHATDPVLGKLRADLQELSLNMTNADTWQTRGWKRVAASMHEYGAERAVQASTSRRSCFQTPSKSKFIMKSQEHDK